MPMLEQPHITPDPMMEELYAIKEHIYETTRHLSPEETLAWYHREAQKAARLIGCKLVSDPDRRDVSRLVPLEEGET